MDGFYAPDADHCQDQGCKLTAQHLHCAHPRCVFATDRSSAVAQHKEFHERVDILEQFICFDRMADCRSQACLQ